jgi:hypothetical protein
VDFLKTSFRPLAASALFLLAVGSVSAQSQTVDFTSPMNGDIAAGEAQNWSFLADSGEVVSIKVEATSGDLDPAISIINSAGMPLISNDDFDYPDVQDALLEAVTIPRTGMYTVSVSGVGDAEGGYSLTMLPGFAQVENSENFNGDLTWQALNDTTEVEAIDGRLSVAVAGMRQFGAAIAPDTDLPETYYAQVAVNVGSGNGWMVGITARHNNDNYYLLNINANGQWRFVIRQTDGEQILRDWTPHPAIIAGQTTFELGILVNGKGFDFFYDGQVFGSVTDDTLPETGTIGLAVETPDDPTARTSATFDDLLVTIPMEKNGERIIPQQLIVSTPSDMAQEIQRRGLIPAGGEMTLTLNESFVESRQPGVEELLLGRGTTYQDFAIGTTVTLQAQAAGMTGCGLVLRAADDSHYTLAYVDQAGGYGVSQRDGDSFQPGIYGENATAGITHHLLIVAFGDILYYYLDGQYSGKIDNPAVDGAVGNAVVNFEPISTSCQFTNTWLWRWDGS